MLPAGGEKSRATEQDAIRIGVAGWNIPKPFSSLFPESGAHLERYSRRLNSVEINSSFYRSHRPKTYARWAASVPPEFRFCVKMPKAITHQARLRDCGAALETFITEITFLEEQLGCLLVQLPPSLAFAETIATKFLIDLRRQFDKAVVLEPRHSTWFSDFAEDLMANYEVGRVAADPQLHPKAAQPGGANRVQYFRLHGSPKVYYSAYSTTYLADLGQSLRSRWKSGSEVWCIFDNTAEGFATGNALELQRIVEENPAILPPPS